MTGGRCGGVQRVWVTRTRHPPGANNGAWCGTGNGAPLFCNIYNPPGRNWDYDTDFQQVENLPPLTPRFVSVQQILFTENFR